MTKNASLWGVVRGKKQAINRVKTDFFHQKLKEHEFIEHKRMGKCKKNGRIKKIIICAAPLGGKKIQKIDNFWGALRGPKNKKI